MNRDPNDIQLAKQTAKRLFKKYSFAGPQLGQYELSSIISDTYQHLNINFKPTPNDSKAMNKVLDANHDGKVTYDDLEQMCIRYLCDGISMDSKSYSQTMLPPSPQKGFETAIHGNSFGDSNRGIFDKYAKDSQYPQNPVPSSGQSYQSHTVQSSFQEQSQSQNYQSFQTQQQTIVSSTTVTKTEQRSHQFQQNQEAVLTSQQAPAHQNQSLLSQTSQPEYSSQVRQYLTLTQQIFAKHALPTNTITSNEVPHVLSETYAALGRTGYSPTADDVAVWMKLCDGNSDGHVEYDEYQYFVVRSLERSGVNLYEQQ